MEYLLGLPLMVKAFIGLSILVIGFCVYAFGFSDEKKEESPFLVEYKTDQGSKFVDVKRGLAILGAAGSGKSASGFVPIFKHCAQKRLSVINYDYKDGELTEMLNFFYKDVPDIPVYNIYPSNIDYSHKINPIAPHLMPTFNDVNRISSALMNNLSPTSGDNAIFGEIGESALAGVIQRTKEDYPDECNLPMVCSILMTKDGLEVIEYIKKSQYASLLGKAYTESSLNEKLFGAVQTTIANALRKIVSPELFMIFGSSDFDLALNKPDNISVLNVINHPKYDTVLAPFLAVVVECAIMQMSERGRNPSLLNLDEASTIKLDKMSRKPATLRSYNFGTVFGLQDKVQGIQLYGENELKAIMANLGAKILGKSNDPDTSAFYERLFELIMEKQVSISQSSGFSLKGGETRESISKREITKHRAYEFGQLQAGQFFLFDHLGKNHKVKFKMEECVPTKIKRLHNYSKTELELNFKDVLDRAKNLV